MGECQNKKMVSHEGVVKTSTESSVDVLILAQEACHACRAKEMCVGGDMAKEKIIHVVTLQATQFSPGEHVKVSIREDLGFFAIFIVYVVPLLLIVFTLLLLLSLSVSEGIAGLSALATGIVYYLILSLFRSRIENKVVFTIEKIAHTIE